MDKIKTSKDIDHRRRHFVGTAALTAAAAQLGMIGAVDAQPGKAKVPSVKPGSHTSFGPLKQIDAGLLNVGYAEAGPADGPPVLLLHGWPYKARAWISAGRPASWANSPMNCPGPWIAIGSLSANLSCRLISTFPAKMIVSPSAT